MPAADGLPLRVGPYPIRAELGRGGMGVVYLATHQRLGRKVALKVLLDANPESVLRFQREAQVASRIDDPGIVPVWDMGNHEGRPYFVMEYCPGPTLAKHLEAGPLGDREAARLVAALARTTSLAHRAGVLHRDLKPANVILAGKTPRITDFGLARDLGPGARSLTRTGTMMGTPAYMAPEQFADSKRVDARADVYSLGVILYECLTGQRPYSAPTLMQVVTLAEAGNPTPPTEVVPSISPELERICLRAMAADPRERYASSEELAARLALLLEDGDQEVDDHDRRPTRTPGVLAAVAVLVVAAGVSIWALRTEPVAEEPGPSPVASSEPEPTPDPSPPPRAGSRVLLERARRLSRDVEPLPSVRRLLERARLGTKNPELRAEIELELLDLLLRRGQFSAGLALIDQLQLSGRMRRRAQLLRAFFLKRRGRHEAAFEVLEDLRDEDANDPTCLNAGAIASYWGRQRHRGDLIAAALRKDPDDLYAQLSRFYWLLLERKDVPAAESLLTGMLERAPDHGLLLWARVSLATKKGGIASAVPAMGRVIELTRPVPHFDAHSLRGTHFHNKRRYEEALRDFDQALLARPEAVSALVLRGVVAFHLGREEESGRYYKKACLAAPDRFEDTLDRLGNRQMRQLIRIHLVEALRLQLSEPWDELRARLLARAKLAPAPARGLLQELLLKAAGGAPVLELVPGLQRLERLATSPAVALELVRIALGRDLYPLCQGAIRRAGALALDRPQRLELLRHRAELLWRRGRITEATRQWKALAQEDSRGIDGRTARVQLAILRNPAQRARLTNLEELVRLASQRTDLRVLMCMELAVRGRPFEAIQHSDAALALHGALDTSLLTNRAILVSPMLWKIRGHGESLKEFEKLFSLSMGSYHLLQAAAWVLRQREPQTYSWCERVLVEARRREPQRAALHTLQGILALLTRRPAEEILKHWRRAGELDPDQPPIREPWIGEFKRLHGDHPDLGKLLQNQ